MQVNHKVFLFLILFLIPVSAWGFGLFSFQGGAGATTTGGGGAPSYPATPLINETFEGVGMPASWGTLNVVDPDESTVYSQGSESCFIDYNGTDSQAYYDNGLTPASELWGFFRIRSDFATGGGTYVFFLGERYYGTEGIYIRQYTADNRFRMYHGTSYLETGAMSADTWYAVWWHWTTGSGADGVYQMWMDTVANACNGTTCTRPTIVIDGSNGTGTSSAVDSFSFKGDNTDIYVDQVIFDDEEITDVQDN